VNTAAREGTWEFAALSVFHDAHYQLALTWLTFALDLSPRLGAETHLLIPYVKSLRDASELLTDVLFAHVNFGGQISYPKGDLYKNAALCHLRYVSGLKIGMQIGMQIGEGVDLGEGYVGEATEKAREVVEIFVEHFPDDENVEIFRSFLGGFSENQPNVKP